MVLLTTTSLHLSLISSLPQSALSKLPKTSTLPTSLSDPISHSTLILLSRLARTFLDDANKYSLNSLVRHAAIYRPSPPPPAPKSPEYLALMAQLRAEAESRSYAALLSQQEERTQIGPFDGSDAAKDDVTPSLVANILLSVLMCAGAVWVMTRYWTNDGLRVLTSLATAIVVAVAEVVVYNGYLRKVRIAGQKERRVRERKEVVGTDIVCEKGSDDTRLVGEEEQIWGRGVNKGMRRRVREKWERERDKKPPQVDTSI